MQLDYNSIVCHQWSCDPQKFAIVLRVEDQPDNSIVLAAYLNLGDSRLKIATISERLVPVLGRDVAIWHCKSHRVNVATNVPVEPRKLVVSERGLLLSFEKAHRRPFFYRVWSTPAVERRRAQNYFFTLWCRAVWPEVKLGDLVDVICLTLAQIGYRAHHKSLWVSYQVCCCLVLGIQEAIFQAELIQRPG